VAACWAVDWGIGLGGVGGNLFQPAKRWVRATDVGSRRGNRRGKLTRGIGVTFEGCGRESDGGGESFVSFRKWGTVTPPKLALANLVELLAIYQV
jgi:hypothetical protein